MDETKNLEREYVIPLRKHWIRVQNYKRTSKAIKAIKQFVAKHMKVLDRDLSKVKLDPYFNNELWFRGRRHPPSKIKVKAKKEGDLVYVTFVEEPNYVKFLKAKQTKVHIKSEAKSEEKSETKAEEKEKKEEKIEEKEKEASVKEQKLKEAESKAKAQKHVTKIKETKIQRMALKK